MTPLHRTHVPCVVLIVFAAGLALHAQAVRQAPPAEAVPQIQVAPAAPIETPATNVIPSAATATTPYPIAQRYNLLLTDGRPSTEPVLVIPGKPMDAQAIDQAVEDLSVMSRIIEKNALREYRALGDYPGMAQFVWAPRLEGQGMGPGVFFPSPGRPKPMYVGGYGVLFFIQVSCPLLPPPQTPQEQPAGQQDDPVWAQTKRDVLEPRGYALAQVGEQAEALEPYTREKVDALRSDLIATMKHATNIRILQPNEWITIVVQGVAPAPQAAQSSSSVPMVLPTTATPTRRTMLTLRVTKADIDQYAKGQLNQQQFEQRLQIVTY